MLVGAGFVGLSIAVIGFAVCRTYTASKGGLRDAAVRGDFSK